MAKTISRAERQHQDYLRLRGLKVGQVYESRLIRLRAREVRRVLDLCRDVAEPSGWPDVIDIHLDESGYLPGWWDGLFRDAGLPMAKSTARDLKKSKAAEEDGIWLRTLSQYAARRAGESIVSVLGTLKETLIGILRRTMRDEPGLGIEQLTKKIYAQYRSIAKWEVRRIAQTETMIGMADAAAMAADTLEVPFVKQWAVSGLGNTRESHLAMDGVIQERDEPFLLEGGQVMYPHDTSLGAAASEIINCACACIRRPK